MILMIIVGDEERKGYEKVKKQKYLIFGVDDNGEKGIVAINTAISSICDQKILNLLLQHPCAVRMLQTEKKTIVLEKQQTSQSLIFPDVFFPNSPFMDLTFIAENIKNPSHHTFKLYNPEKDLYVPFQQISNSPFMIPRRYLQLSIIMIRYSEEVSPFLEESESQSSSEHKKQRSKQRTIGEVIELVKQWRELHTTSTSSRKKMNLQEAARIIGVSKKSLDDYYYQLRVGEKHDFDFASHLNDKIGVLRAFIKQKEPEKRMKDRNMKHPKKLKLIEEFSQKLTLKESPPKAVEKQISLKIEEQNDSQMNYWGSPFTPISPDVLNNCANNFFKDFEYSLDEPNDPFINFNASYRKASSEDIYLF